MSTTKTGKNTTNILKFLFFIINLHSVTSIQISIYIYKNLNLPLTSSIYFVFLPLEMQKKTQTDQSIPCVFLLCLKRNDPQTFKCQLQKSFPPVCMLLLKLALMFFILCDNWKTLLFMKVCRYSEIFLSAMLLLSLKPVF